MQFTHNIDGVVHTFTADPNEIHVITYKEVKYLCDKNENEWKNQTYMQFIKQLKTNFFNEKEGRIIFSKEQRQTVLKRFNNVCNNCMCSILKDKFDIDY